MRHAFMPILTVACLAGCSISPVSLTAVPNKSDFSEKQLIEDHVILSGKVEELLVSSGSYPNIMRAVIDSNLDNTLNAVLNDIAGTEEIRDRYFNLRKLKFEDSLKLIATKEFQELTRSWGKIEFRMSKVSFLGRFTSDRARISIDNAKYNPEDAIEGSLGSTLFESNPLTNRTANIVIYFYERDGTHTVVTVLNYMSYGTRVGNGSLLYPVDWKQFQAISKGNIERAIINNIASAAARSVQPSSQAGSPQAARP